MTFPGFQIIEIVLALLTLYMFLSILITAFTEFWDYIFKRKQYYFKKSIKNLLGYSDYDYEYKFLGNKLIKSIDQSTDNKFTDIPDDIIADVILNIWYRNNEVNKSNTDNLNQLIQIQKRNAGTKKDLVKIKKNLKKWLIEYWKPITKYYKTRTSIITLISAFFLACVFNLDTIMLVRLMWANRSISQIEEISAKAVTPDSSFFDSKCEIEKNRYWSHVESTSRQHQYRFFPLGWTWDDNINCRFKNLRGFPFTSLGLINKLPGLLFTALMVSLGTNFWFKVLEKYIKVKV